jgi:predicted nucleic acid-binding protein
MRTLVDASVWIAYFGGGRSHRVDWLDASLGRANLVVADLTLAQVLPGLADDGEHAAARAALLKFPVVATGGPDLALQAAAHLRALRAAGVPAPPLPQALVATACLAQGMRLLHQDPAYEPFETHLGLATPGLVVEMW